MGVDEDATHGMFASRTSFTSPLSVSPSSYVPAWNLELASIRSACVEDRLVPKLYAVTGREEAYATRTERYMPKVFVCGMGIKTRTVLRVCKRHVCVVFEEAMCIVCYTRWVIRATSKVEPAGRSVTRHYPASAYMFPLLLSSGTATAECRNVEPCLSLIRSEPGSTLFLTISFHSFTTSLRSFRAAASAFCLCLCSNLLLSLPEQ